MHLAVLFADENKKLRATNECQKNKRAVQRSYLALGGVLSVQKGLDWSLTANIRLTG